jgi:hypothetical protein
MEHSYIEEHNIADLYLMGKLSAEEGLRFEEHCENCMQCFDQLETIVGMRRGLRIVAGEEVRRSRAYLEAGLLARIARLSRATRAALLAGVILLIALPLGSLILEWSRARRNLTRATQIAGEWQRKYEERELAMRDLMKEMQARDRQSSAQQDRATVQPGRERVDHSRMPNETEQADVSQAVVPVFALSDRRGEEPDLSRPANRIRLSPSSKWIILLLELGPDPGLQSYRAAISRADGRSIWRASQLKPNSNDALALSFNASRFKPGNYLLTLEGLTTQNRYVLVARYTFSAIQ